MRGEYIIVVPHDVRQICHTPASSRQGGTTPDRRVALQKFALRQLRLALGQVLSAYRAECLRPGTLYFLASMNAEEM